MIPTINRIQVIEYCANQRQTACKNIVVISPIKGQFNWLLPLGFPGQLMMTIASVKGRHIEMKALSVRGFPAVENTLPV